MSSGPTVSRNWRTVREAAARAAALSSSARLMHVLLAITAEFAALRRAAGGARRHVACERCSYGVGIWKPGVERDSAVSSSFISSAMPSNSGVDR